MRIKLLKKKGFDYMKKKKEKKVCLIELVA